jgi:hypothetical protein
MIRTASSRERSDRLTLMYAPPFFAAWRNRSASFDFARVIAGRPHTDTGWVGIEHEFLCHDASGKRVDFRTVIPTLDLGPGNLVPSDLRARWLPSGTVLTADQLEAEIATPPIALRPGFATVLDGWARSERDRLGEHVNPIKLTGDSTHINVTVPRDVDPDAVADLFASRYAVGQMLLMDRRASPGLLVRPRPNRLEIGGEYAVGSALRAAVAYAAGATLACVEAARTRNAASLPEALEVRLERGKIRYGWYASRTAFGGDLYAEGRSATLRTKTGGVITANEAMAAAWRVARANLAPLACDADLVDADQMVGGGLQLPIERGDDDLEHQVASPVEPSSEFGKASMPCARPGYDLAPVMLTWELAVFLIADEPGHRFAFGVVPGRALDGFLSALDGGALDESIVRYLAHPPTARRLTKFRQTARPGLYDQLGLRAALLAPERDYWGNSISLRALGRMPVQQPLGLSV